MHDLTKGSIARNLLQTTTMMLVGMVFQTLYFLIDLKFVGMLGAKAVAVLMFGWVTGQPLGVAGTAIASFVAVVVGVIGLIAYVARKKEGYLRLVAAEFRPRFSTWARMLKIGLPAGAEFFFMGTYMFV